jgi:hypothetical protein
MCLDPSRTVGAVDDSCLSLPASAGELHDALVWSVL